MGYRVRPHLKKQPTKGQSKPKANGMEHAITLLLLKLRGQGNPASQNALLYTSDSDTRESYSFAN